jgi:hypothetical protein
MKSLADALPPEFARQIHPDWRKNEAAYWAVRDQLLSVRSVSCCPAIGTASLCYPRWARKRAMVSHAPDEFHLRYHLSQRRLASRERRIPLSIHSIGGRNLGLLIALKK